MKFFGNFGKKANKKEIKIIEAFLLASQEYLNTQEAELVGQIETMLVKTATRFFKIPPSRFTLEKFIEFFRAEAEKPKYEQDISGYLSFIDNYLDEHRLMATGS